MVEWYHGSSTNSSLHTGWERVLIIGDNYLTGFGHWKATPLLEWMILRVKLLVEFQPPWYWAFNRQKEWVAFHKPPPKKKNKKWLWVKTLAP